MYEGGYYLRHHLVGINNKINPFEGSALATSSELSTSQFNNTSGLNKIKI